jgi:hypothetical protein
MVVRRAKLIAHRTAAMVLHPGVASIRKLMLNIMA